MRTSYLILTSLEITVRHFCSCERILYICGILKCNPVQPCDGRNSIFEFKIQVNSVLNATLFVNDKNENNYCNSWRNSASCNENERGFISISILGQNQSISVIL